MINKFRNIQALKWFFSILSYTKNVLLIKAQFNFNLLLRYTYLSDPRYNNLKKFRNKFSNERCFIIATGPSLKIDDVLKLKNEYTFGMNSLCSVFNEVGFETTFYAIQDYLVYNKLKDDIKKINQSEIFISDFLAKRENITTNINIYPLDYLNHKYTYKKLTAKFSGNSFNRVYDGYSITLSILQLAVYMGFKEIYLIGADCNYSDDKSKHHFINYGHYDSTYKSAGTRMIYAYKVAKKYADKNNIKIYNATRGGMLEVFPRVDLDELLDLRRKEWKY